MAYQQSNYAQGCTTCGSYNLESHGDIGATYNSLTNADLPSYAHGFYSPTQHEQLSDVKYSKLKIGYQKDLREIHDAVKGLPLEAYVPKSMIVPVGGGSPVVHEPKIVAKKSVKDEIERAQREVIKQEDLVKEIQIDQLILRRIRARVVRKKPKNQKI